jgi:transcriptional regulator with XRE-family HTH domain
MTPEARFWKKVDRRGADECWLWTGAKASGYGFFSVNGKRMLAHRFSYELHKGALGEKDACHDCPGGDNKACVNPAHLWPGTDAENKQDYQRKRIVQLRSQPPNVTDASTLADRIISLRQQRGWTQQDLAHKAGVPRPWLSLVEIGDIAHPSADRLQRIANVLGIDSKYLLSGSADARRIPLYVDADIVGDLSEFASWDEVTRRASLAAGRTFLTMLTELHTKASVR